MSQYPYIDFGTRSFVTRRPAGNPTSGARARLWLVNETDPQPNSGPVDPPPDPPPTSN